MISIVTPWLNMAHLIPDYEAAVAGAEVIVVDQASDADTAAALEAMCARLGNVSRVLHSETNLKFAAGNNLGYRATSGDIVVFLNNDIVGSNAWLTQVGRDVQPGGLYSPTVLPFDVDGEVYPYCEGWCLAAARETWEALEGPWDAATYPHAYAEDVDLSWRARLAGLSLFKTRWQLKHIGNATTNTLPGAKDHADEQREIFRQRVRAWKAKRAA